MGKRLDEHCIGMGDLIVRVDASSQIGSGHLLRCMALAQAFQKRGGRVIFLTHCDSPVILGWLKEEGFPFLAKEKTFPDRSDLVGLLAAVSSVGGKTSSRPLVVVDGYHFNSDYQKGIRDAGCFLLVIDDMAHLPFYHGHMLLNQNLHACSLDYSCYPGALRLLGPHYILLRQEFLLWADRRKNFEKKGHRILVTLGGSDPGNITSKIIRSLKLTGLDDLHVKVVVGPANIHGRAIEKEASGASCRLDLLYSVKDMPSLMAWADLAISAGGSTCWEMAYMGLPNFVAVLAENQRDVAERLDREGCSINLGRGEEIESERLSEQLVCLMNDSERRAFMSKVGRRFVDGRGTERVLDAWTGLRQSHVEAAA